MEQFNHDQTLLLHSHRYDMIPKIFPKSACRYLKSFPDSLQHVRDDGVVPQVREPNPGSLNIHGTRQEEPRSCVPQRERIRCWLWYWFKRFSSTGHPFSYRWWRRRSCVSPGSGWGGAKPAGSNQWSSPAPCCVCGCRSLSQSAFSSGSAPGSPSLAPCGWHTAPTLSESSEVCEKHRLNPTLLTSNWMDGWMEEIGKGLPEVVVKLQVGRRWCCLAHGANNVGAERTNTPLSYVGGHTALKQNKLCLTWLCRERTKKINWYAKWYFFLTCLLHVSIWHRAYSKHLDKGRPLQNNLKCDLKNPLSMCHGV